MEAQNKKVSTPLPIGKSSFPKIIEEGCYYIDKTLFIKELLDRRTEVTLCTRPRRFGKTLNQTMLKCFFENTSRLGGADTRLLFNGLKIESAGKEYMAHQGKYPVIFLSFKEAGLDTFEKSYLKLTNDIAGEFKRHYYTIEKIPHETDRAQYQRIADGIGSLNDYSDSLKFLCKCLEDYYGQKPIILIDEYDVPLQNSWLCGFYKEMINFIRPLLGAALKDNAHLQFAVVTGCLRISKESIFTGLNNPNVISIRSPHYSEYFGFTQNEMDTMLSHYGLMEKRQLIKDWYDGYLFGNTEVYNPWSSIHVVDNWVKDINMLPEPYWSNTSGNDIVRKLIDRADSAAKADLETLMAGGTISKLTYEDITYDEIEKNIDNLWNFLFFTGYLKKISETVDDKGRIITEMKIPNVEVNIIYVNKIQDWFDKQISEKNLDTFYNAILTCDVETFQREFSLLLLDSISFWDSAESFYHGFMTGVLSPLQGKGYVITSNHESGHGRSDLVLHNRLDKAIIFEFKTAKDFQDLPNACTAALKQIEDSDYAAYWRKDGYTDIMKYGIGFYKKRCLIKSAF